MWRCPLCGHVNPESTDICEECGCYREEPGYDIIDDEEELTEEEIWDFLEEEGEEPPEDYENYEEEYDEEYEDYEDPEDY